MCNHIDLVCVFFVVSPAGNDIWAWHDAVTGDHYAIACTTGGTSFVRVTDPYNPVVLGFLYSQSDFTPIYL